MLVHRMGTRVWITMDLLGKSASDLRKDLFLLVDENYFVSNLQAELAA